MSTVMDQSNRTFIGSVVFVDIVGYTKKSVSDQIIMKDRFTSLLSDSLKDISSDQRIILDTGDGAALSFIGDPEDALFVGMNMRDMLKDVTPGAAEPNDQSTSSSSDLFLRIGINLGPIKLVRDINGQPNIVGDGINVAQRIMSFARPGQVVVSRSYFDVVSVISDEYAQLFKYEGSRTDKHVREHEIYVVGDSAAAFNKAKSGMEDRAAATNPRNKPAASVDKKSGNSERAKKVSASTSSNTEAAVPIPLMQDKKKLSIIGGVLGAVVLVLAVLVATKKPAIDATKNDAPAAAATTIAAAAPGSVAVTTTPLSAAPAVESSQTPTTAATPTPLTKATTAADTTAATAPATKLPAPASVPAATKAVDPATKVEPTKAATAQGTLTFAVSPWGEVLINGKSIGTSPPVKQHKLAPGKYKVEVRNSTLTPFITTIDVKSKEDVTIRHQFK